MWEKGSEKKESEGKIGREHISARVPCKSCSRIGNRVYSPGVPYSFPGPHALLIGRVFQGRLTSFRSTRD